jgi:hypothetical protein
VQAKADAGFGTKLNDGMFLAKIASKTKKKSGKINHRVKGD